MTILNADFLVIFKKPVKTQISDPRYNELWNMLIVGKVYHVIGISEETGDYRLEFFDPEIIFEKEAFQEISEGF